MFLRVHSENLASLSLGEFCSDFVEQTPFFRIQSVLREVACLSDHEPELALEFRVEICAMQSSEAIGV
ncbi:MAG TPA: hypothetical protein VGL74_08490, partial [Terriglobales bacterium]